MSGWRSDEKIRGLLGRIQLANYSNEYAFYYVGSWDILPEYAYISIISLLKCGISCNFRKLITINRFLAAVWEGPFRRDSISLSCYRRVDL